MEQTECSEMLAHKIQTPGNYPEESIQHSEDSESLKSRLQTTYLLAFVRYSYELCDIVTFSLQLAAHICLFDTTNIGNRSANNVLSILDNLAGGEVWEDGNRQFPSVCKGNMFHPEPAEKLRTKSGPFRLKSLTKECDEHCSWNLCSFSFTNFENRSEPVPLEDTNVWLVWWKYFLVWLVNPTPKLTSTSSISSSCSIIGSRSSAQQWIIMYCTLKETSINWQAIH